MSGLFITFEGLDGSGKSTQLERVAANLDRRGIDHVVTREPGGTPFAEQLRRVVLATDAALADGVVELLLMFASRHQHLAEVIEPAIAAGEVVLCDRFTDSTYAYQGGGRGVPLDLISDMDLLVTGSRTPDRTLFFDLPAVVAQRRRGEGSQLLLPGIRQRNRIDRESLEFYDRVDAAYKDRVAADPDRFRVIDAAASVEVVAREVEAALVDLLVPLRVRLAGA